ncbi:MAG: PhoX family phosphatase [Actinomycetota bacterium]
MADSEDVSSNPSDNRPFHDVLDVAISRRTVIVGSLAVAATTAFIEPGVVGARNTPEQARRLGFGNGQRSELVGFEPIPNDEELAVPAISDDYEFQVLIPWGTPLFSGVPELDPTDVAANAPYQDRQIGLGHDGMWFFPDRRRPNTQGVLCINHEFGTNFHIFQRETPVNQQDDGPQPTSLAEVRYSQDVHGVSVVELHKTNSGWTHVVDGARNRRITPNTPMDFTGPAARSALLETAAGNEPAGTVNNCANGKTPWGTYLTCEENFNGYFGARNPEQWTPTAEQERYGFSETGFDYGWYLFDDRWDLSNPQYANEENRFGWIVEVDPDRPHAKPRKRTALGRFKHENAEVVVGRGGRVVVYMGDDQRFDYIYKFVSARNWRSMFARGIHPFDEGTLYVARFDDDYTGKWLELSPDNPALAGWSMDEILVYTRLAADAVGATPMDRPEWITAGQRRTVYCALTNNSQRTEPNAANPLAPNPDGHIIRWRDTRQYTGRRFRWDIYVLAQDTRPENGGDPEGTFTDPDGLWADPDGRLFIETDGGQPFGNNQLVVSDIRREEFRRLFAGVKDDEITGLTVTPNRRTMFINTQHPGDGSPAATNFPATENGEFITPAQPDGPVPRDSTIVITRKNGGIVGS